MEAEGERARLCGGEEWVVGPETWTGRGVEEVGEERDRVGGAMVAWAAVTEGSGSEVERVTVESGVAGVRMRMVWRGAEGAESRGCSMSTTTLSLRRPDASYETNTRSAKAA